MPVMKRYSKKSAPRTLEDALVGGIASALVAVPGPEALQPKRNIKGSNMKTKRPEGGGALAVIFWWLALRAAFVARGQEDTGENRTAGL